MSLIASQRRLEREPLTIKVGVRLLAVPGKVVAQLIGHAKVDTTLHVYTQVLDASVRSAADRVGAELFTIVHSLAGEVAVTR